MQSFIKKILFTLLLLICVVSQNVYADENENYTGRLSVGGESSGAIASNGDLYVWGVDHESSEVLLDKMRYTYFSDQFFAGIDQDNNLWMWGTNGSGRLGNSEDTNGRVVEEPKMVTDNVAQVSLGGTFTAALKFDGTLWVWGDNEKRQLGYDGEIHKGEGNFDSDINYSSEPYNLLSGVKSVSCGNEYTLVVKNDGSLWGWGNNENHQITWTTINTDTPIPISKNKKFVDCYAGTSFSAAITENNELYLWGSDMDLFRTFTNTGTWQALDNADPFLTDIQDFAFGERTFYALKTDGTVLVWGTGENGQFGLPKDQLQQYRDDVFGYVYVEEPLEVFDHCTNLYVGGLNSKHIMVRKDDGTLWGWGDNRKGQLIPGGEDVIWEPTQLNDIDLGPLSNKVAIFNLNPLFYVTSALALLSFIGFLYYLIKLVKSK